jgi:hypothetical protein
MLLMLPFIALGIHYLCIVSIVLKNKERIEFLEACVKSLAEDKKENKT